MLFANKENIDPEEPGESSAQSTAVNQITKRQAMLILLCLEKSNNPISRQEFADRLNHYFAASQAYANDVGKAIESFRKRLEEAMYGSEYGMRPIPRFNRMKPRDICEYFAISRWCDGSLDLDIASELGHRFSIRGVERF